MARKSKTAERLAALRVNPERVRMLEQVMAAIQEGKAYLDTYLGRKQVLSYNDSTGWASTGTGFSAHSFMVCISDIKIDA